MDLLLYSAFRFSLLSGQSASARVDFKVLVYKALNGLGSEYINDMVKEYQPSRTLRSTSSGQLMRIRVQTKQGEAAFSYYGPTLWNKLPTQVRSAPDVDTFKSKLETFLFSLVFDTALLVCIILSYYYIFKCSFI